MAKKIITKFVPKIKEAELEMQRIEEMGRQGFFWQGVKVLNTGKGDTDSYIEFNVYQKPIPEPTEAFNDILNAYKHNPDAMSDEGLIEHDGYVFIVILKWKKDKIDQKAFKLLEVKSIILKSYYLVFYKTL